MNTIPAQEIKQRGISAVDDLLDNGPVHVILRNRPRYVVLDEAHYQELLEAQEEAILARYRAVRDDVRAGRVRRFTDSDELTAAVMAYGSTDQP
jgi:PHD/YefM family antitoxin component YafN of YafNO toxin-antitoxin module